MSGGDGDMNEPARRSLTTALRQMAARWIGTPWWNLRFTLGYWIGGFTHAERKYE